MTRTTNGGPPRSQWVLDASAVDVDEDIRAWCPVTPDGAVMMGLTVVTDRPPGSVIGVFHPDGQQACDAWTETHADYLERLMEELNGD